MHNSATYLGQKMCYMSAGYLAMYKYKYISLRIYCYHIVYQSLQIWLLLKFKKSLKKHGHVTVWMMSIYRDHSLYNNVSLSVTLRWPVNQLTNSFI